MLSISTLAALARADAWAAQRARFIFGMVNVADLDRGQHVPFSFMDEGYPEGNPTSAPAYLRMEDRLWSGFIRTAYRTRDHKAAWDIYQRECKDAGIR